MRFANWADGQFVNASSMNTAEDLTEQSLALAINGLHTPGLFNTASSQSISGLVFTITLNSPFGIAFGNGILAEPFGTVDGALSSTYVTDFSSLIPVSGSVTAYLIATHLRIGYSAAEIVGPPVGHPDYDPAFAPFISYTETVDSLALAATLTPADDYNTFEICRFTLIAGQTVLNSADFGHQRRAGAMLSRNGEVLSADLAVTGVTAGTYFPPSITVDVDGRLTAASRQLVGSSDLTATGVGAGTYFPPSITVGADGRLTAASRQLVGTSDMTTTGVTAGTYRIAQTVVGVDGRLTSVTPTLVATSEMTTTGVTAGTYRIPQMTVGVDGRLTAASNVLVGSSDMVPTGVAGGTYSFPQMTVGTDGRVSAAKSYASSFAGNPNGSVAGFAATSGTPASLIFDYTNNLLWECTFTGTTSTSQWRVTNGVAGTWIGQTASATLAVPNWALSIEAMVEGGGGGGSTCQSTAPYSSTSSSGGGGGAGGFAWGVYPVTPGASLSAVVGAGGITEVDGGSSFISGLLTTTGGSGARFQNANNSAGGTGGVGGGGTIMNSGGTDGSDGQSGAFIFAGNGGAGPWGGAGRAGNGGGLAATGYGSGGGGAYDSAATGVQKFGGAGFQGIILYRWLS